MDSIRTISCKLLVTDAQARHIEATMQAFADACNFVAEYGRTHRVSRQYDLHKACYAEVRSRFGLSANLAVRAIARVAPCLCKARTRNSTFKPTSVDYDARIFRFVEESWNASLTLLDGRVKLPLKVGDFQREALQGQQRSAASPAMMVRILSRLFTAGSVGRVCSSADTLRSRRFHSDLRVW